MAVLYFKMALLVTISHLSASCSSRFLRDGEFTVLVYFILKVHFFFFPFLCF